MELVVGYIEGEVVIILYAAVTVQIHDIGTEMCGNVDNGLVKLLQQRHICIRNSFGQQGEANAVAGYGICRTAIGQLIIYTSDTVGTNKADGSGTYPVTIQPKTGKTRYRDFLNMIKLSGLKVSKIRFTDLVANGSHEIFGQDLEISKSTIGGKGGTDVVNLSAHINPANFLQNFIDVDLAGNNLRLDETTLMFMEIPANADFNIEFTLA